MSYRVVIPARFGSTRLPGKALLLLAGKPMVQWVFEHARRAGAAEVIIATDDERIARAAREFGAEARMTDVAHASGTDRIAEVARLERWAPNDVVVNVQGDEPLMPPALIEQVAGVLARYPQADIATLAAPLESEAAFTNPNVVKVVSDRSQRALYFSRAAIPWTDAAPAATGARRHVGLYAYRVAALQRMAALPPSALERRERLEQLRALEHGMDIRVADAAVAAGADVNTADDLASVEALLLAGR